MRLLLLSLIFFCTLSLNAQGTITPMHVTGKVMHIKSDNETPVKIQPGFPIQAKGKIRCEANSSVKLLYNGKTFVFKGENTLDLNQEVVQKASATSSLGLSGRFWNFITSSMEGTEDEKKLEKHHRNAMATTHAGIKGWAIGQFAMGVDLVYTGQFGKGDIQLKWGEFDTRFYTLVLTRQSDNAEIARIRTSSNSCKINLEELDMSNGKYEWQAFAGDPEKETPSTPVVLFDYQPGGEAELLNRTRNHPAYKDALEIEQALMEAFALEEARYFYSAGNVYNRLSESHGSNMLVRRAHASFTARMGKLELAQSMLN